MGAPLKDQGGSIGKAVIENVFNCIDEAQLEIFGARQGYDNFYRYPIEANASFETGAIAREAFPRVGFNFGVTAAYLVLETKNCGLLPENRYSQTIRVTMGSNTAKGNQSTRSNSTQMLGSTNLGSQNSLSVTNRLGSEKTESEDACLSVSSETTVKFISFVPINSWRIGINTEIGHNPLFQVLNGVYMTDIDADKHLADGYSPLCLLQPTTALDAYTVSFKLVSKIKDFRYTPTTNGIIEKMIPLREKFEKRWFTKQMQLYASKNGQKSRHDEVMLASGAITINRAGGEE